MSVLPNSVLKQQSEIKDTNGQTALAIEESRNTLYRLHTHTVAQEDKVINPTVI